MPTLHEQIEKIKSENRSLDEEADSIIKHLRANDQSRIAWLIIWAFVLSIGGIFALVLIHPFASARYEWKEPAQFLGALISSVLLPIVTLVLGYYFGKEKQH